MAQKQASNGSLRWDEDNLQQKAWPRMPWDADNVIERNAFFF